MEEQEDKRSSLLGELLRVVVLLWSLCCLSMNYLGHVKAMDPTFPASLLTGILGSMGVNVSKKNGNGNSKNNGSGRKDPITGKNIRADGRLEK